MKELAADFEKFIVAPYVLTEPVSALIILTDYKFWTAHLKELELWNTEQGNVYQIKGMTVICSDNHSLTAFILKWS